ncbi:translation initiation factor eIF4e [Aureobasidium pullulans]|nr:translation initiation factor eIF4e [Aureobasidium pullulans]
MYNSDYRAGYKTLQKYIAMAGLPDLRRTGLSGSTPENTPARGKEMRANLLNKLRPPPLVHAWDFWHDRQDRTGSTITSPPPAPPTSSSNNNTAETTTSAKPTHNYEDRLVHLASISDVRTFWNVFNNFDVSALPLRDSVHLFHQYVKPLWEDPRNVHGGCWTFRVPKANAPDFWERIALLAVGEKLQAAVESDRKQFRDDICGVSLSVRFTSVLVQVWNRDAGHEEGIKKLLEAVFEGMEPELMPRENGYYYKPHYEHAAFKGQDSKSGGGEVAASKQA